MKCRALFLLAVLALATGCQRAEDPVARGKITFDAIGCAQCHRIGEKGGEWGPDLSFIGFRKSPEWLDRWLKDPHAWRKQTVMPSFHLNDATRADVVAYLAAQQGQGWGEKRPWNHPDVAGDPVKRGEVLFSKAGCVACHGQNGRGGYPNNNVVGGLIPPLEKVVEGYTEDELKSKIRAGVVPDPADPSEPKPLIQMPAWGKQLKDDEIEAVAKFLIALGSKPGKKKGKDDW